MTETPQEPSAPQPPVQTPAGPVSVAAKQSNGLAIAGMILGIVGLVGLCIWWLALPCAIVGLILSILGRKNSAVTGTGRGMATAGIVLCLVALGLAVIGIILAIVGVAIFSGTVSKMNEMQLDIEEQSMLFLRTLLA